MKCDKKGLLLYAVTDRSWLNGETLYSQVEKALQGGATFIQLREKNLDQDHFMEEALELKKLCAAYHVPFVINDNVEIAAKMDADGVHVGQSDMEAQDVRAILGPDKILGVSAQTVEQAVLAEKHGADYLGVGAVFHTGSKADAEDVSHETLTAICNAVKIPVIAIGGITRDNVTELSGSGICGIAVISAIFAQKDIALILLDVMMPKMDGWEVLKTIRKYSKVPVIMLTARSEERDELQGFSLGVDEYISKPFSPKILVARVEALLRRTNAVSADIMNIGGICIDKAAHRVTIDGKEIELSFKEFELLTYFAENQGIALSREKILNNVWNYDYFGDARTIDTHVKKLRSKMGEKGEYIKTIWGMGYKFEVCEE